ncbi:hypothetical protein JCM10512_4606 [Bacteroides reticulotermitis JCM 10512]|uniref:Uncharacterized protein n=1 Tax=Bacteroides reticulotermitis JCM 10512 TaxID=1445607 RepID=W4UZ64_9BACE|nr:hypothetical protein [Bacteroides reticulotermitis]GAE86117.1 hypothetical protein JCM10512_4606 [Bacteroides reticulotermitis JCM 10512]
MGIATYGLFLIRPDIFAVVGKYEYVPFGVITYPDAPVQAKERNSPLPADRAGKDRGGIV